jgi:N6-adenosine-specific RNA methylase IME4
MTPKINQKFHSLIPPLSPDELSQLEANIIADGCRDPIVLWDGTIVDGHNRFDICTRNKIKFQTVDMEFDGEDEACDWIDANQLGRRNLTPDQRSIIRGRRYNRTKKQGKRTDLVANCNKVDTATALAEKHGVSRATVIRDGKRAEALDKLAETKPEEAKAVLDGKKRFVDVQHEQKIAEVKKAASLPESKYRVIYADPPWSYATPQHSQSAQATRLDNHYQSMSMAELCDLPIHGISQPDAVLFIWVTSPLLFQSLQVISAWGFTYKASFVWDKVKHNVGHYNSVRHELLLICTKGSCLPDSNKLTDSVQSIERTGHSTKPEEFRDIIDTLYPHGKRIELFARKETKGWDTYGNEV